jgi:hypothetical protein
MEAERAGHGAETLRADAIEAPLLRIEVVAQSLGVADVIED